MKEKNLEKLKYVKQVTADLEGKNEEEVQEILSSIKKENYYYLIGDILIQLDIKISQEISLKNKAQKEQNSEAIIKHRVQIKKIQNLQREIRNYREEKILNSMSKEESTIIRNNPYLRRELSAYHDIILVDYVMNSLTDTMFKQYSFDLNPYEKRDLVIAVRKEYELEHSRLKEEKNQLLDKVCEQIEIETSKKLKTRYNKTQIKEYLSKKNYQLWNHLLAENSMNKRKVTAILDSLDSLRVLHNEKIQKLEKLENRKKEKDDFETDYTDVLKTEGEIGVKKLKKLLSFLDFLNQPVLTDHLNNPEMNDSFEKTLQWIKNSDPAIKRQFYFICLDILRGKLLFLNDRSLVEQKKLKEREFLKSFYDYVSRKIEEILVQEKPFETDPYYPIMQQLLEEDRNYTYITDLLKHVPEFRTTRSFVSKKEMKKFKTEDLTNSIDFERQNGHITYDILDRYIHNMKLKLLNQKKEFLDPEYYLKVFEAYFDYENPLFEEEKEYLNSRIDEFYDYIVAKKYSDSEKIFTDLENLKQIISSTKRNVDIPKETIDFGLDDRMMHMLYYQTKGYADLREKNFQKLTDKIEHFKEVFERSYHEKPSDAYVYSMLELTDNDLRNIQFVPTIFGFDKIDQYAYSIYYDEQGTTFLRFHTLDIAALIEEDGKEEKQIREKHLGENEHTFIFPKLIVGKSYPTITYEIPISTKGVPGDVYTYNSIIEMGKIFDEEEIDNYRNNPYVKQLVSAIRKLNITDNSYINFTDSASVKELTEQAISKVLKQLFFQYDIPFLYCNKPYDNEQLVARNHNQTVELLYNIPKKKAHLIFDLLDRNVEKAYCMDPEEDSKIEVDPHQYLGIYLQRLIKKINDHSYELLFRTKGENKEEDHMIENEIRRFQESLIQKLVLDSNQALGYVPELQKRKKRRKKKKKKQINLEQNSLLTNKI